MEDGDSEEALIYAINSCGGNDTDDAMNPNWVTSQHTRSMQQSWEGQTNGGYIPEHSIGLLVCIVGDSNRKDVYGRCIEDTFR